MSRVQREVDVNVPSVARIYDHYLDGKDNFPVDREAAAALDAQMPDTRVLAVNNRRFLERAVETLAREHGVRHFLDHGSGLPTQDNVHQVAQRVDPDSHVVYVDNDPIVLAHGRALLQQDKRTAVIQADMRDTDEIFAHPEVGRLLLEPGKPIAALFLSVLHCIPDPDPEALLSRLLDRLPSGSFVVLSHLVSESAEVRETMTGLMQTLTQGNWGRVRTPLEVTRYFDGLDVLEPGLGCVNDWRAGSMLLPRQKDTRWIEYGGVARVP
jgi:hypothetical protein